MPERCEIDELMHQEAAWHSGECENHASLSISHGCEPRHPGGHGSELHTEKAPGGVSTFACDLGGSSNFQHPNSVFLKCRWFSLLHKWVLDGAGLLFYNVKCFIHK